MSDDKKVLRFVQKVSGHETSQPDTALIAILEEFLSLAKAGEMTHFVGIGIVNNEVWDGWKYPDDPEKGNPYIMLGALQSLNMDLINLTIARR